MEPQVRGLFLRDQADIAESARAERLCRGDADALIELYDDVASLAFTWAMKLTRSKRKSVRILRQVFLRAAQEPHVFCDRRVSSRGWILLEVHHLARSGHPNHEKPSTRRSVVSPG